MWLDHGSWPTELDESLQQLPQVKLCNKSQLFLRERKISHLRIQRGSWKILLQVVLVCGSQMSSWRPLERRVWNNCLISGSRWKADYDSHSVFDLTSISSLLLLCFVSQRFDPAGFHLVWPMEGIGRKLDGREVRKLWLEFYSLVLWLGRDLWYWPCLLWY